MELENQTGLPATLIRGIIRDTELFGSLVARCTFDVGPDGQLSKADEQPWETSPGPWEGPAGKMPGDELFYRGGVDLFVLGSARAPGDRPVRYLEVTAEVGEKFRHAIWVFGDRVWERRQGRLEASGPEPFTAIPLTLENAYGGKDVWDELPIPFPDNPDGKGYYIAEESAEGRPLPNIEDPHRRVAAWNDQPEPVGVGVAPSGFGPSQRRSLEFDQETGMLTRLDPTFFNHAFPGMIAPRSVRPGDWVRVTGVSAAGPFTFVLPPTAIEVRLRVGESRVETVPPIDQIGVEPDLGRVFITYRYPFRYNLVPLEERSCELVATGNA